MDYIALIKMMHDSMAEMGKAFIDAAEEQEKQIARMNTRLAKLEEDFTFHMKEKAK